MKILVTGLCMQGNKGGPALALSLANCLKQQFHGAEILFSVPPGDEFPFEVDAADAYGLVVIQNVDGWKSLIPPFCFNRERFQRTRSWMSAVAGSTAMLQMSAISYVGPPLGGKRTVDSFGGRFFDFCIAKVLRVRFVAWTQSYGPFSNWIVRFLAKLDLKEQGVVFCRGEHSASEVKNLLPGKDVSVYPDVAVTLAYSRDTGAKFLKSEGLDVDQLSRLVTISPSAVVYNASSGRGLLNEHVVTVADTAQALQQLGFCVCLVPHTRRNVAAEPTNCDLKVSELICERLQGSSVFLLKDDLLVGDLKSIIATSVIHIGARYHSVIAALSSGVPTVSLSWHPKYADIMRMYAVEEFVVSDQEIVPIVKAIISNLDAVRSKIEERHASVVESVMKNVEVAVRELRRPCGS